MAWLKVMKRSVDDIVIKEKGVKMDGEVAGMPKFQLIRDFFLDLEGPYKVLVLDDKGNNLIKKSNYFNMLYLV